MYKEICGKVLLKTYFEIIEINYFIECSSKFNLEI